MPRAEIAKEGTVDEASNRTPSKESQRLGSRDAWIAVGFRRPNSISCNNDYRSYAIQHTQENVTRILGGMSESAHW
jgi:hypothetical protein